MLSSNVLCMKKRKKRSYCVSNVSDYGGKYRDKRATSGVTMMHITEDTPPDMLAGAMDLTVHLPNGRAVKMSVERSTPMMDVLVQITTAQQLQHSGYLIHALGMAPSAEHSDKILPYKPNTPIGTLDTQHIRVVAKGRSLPAQRNAAPGQPFESTFRLKVHLPRNQLYVSRVSMNVHLGDIMKKVCDEKNLDCTKYEFRHPGNLDEVLDPKLTLSDYQITEIYVVSRGSSRLSQAFSASDIMALRKDDERKHSKSGGVFNLIFKRGKTSNGSGSLSSDNRSISPTHSDDSRSVTPPGVQQQVPKPKVPTRKRRPAPKPPQPKEEVKESTKNGLTICHSRNSSDSSGYHEASILSDNANTSLPRRIGEGLNGEHSRSTSNLTSMSAQTKSTSSLAFAGRKKKAPPPPPAPTNLDKASPVVASPVEAPDLPTAHQSTNRTPIPAPRLKPPPKPLRAISSQDLCDGHEPEKLVEAINLVVETSSSYEKALESIHVDLFSTKCCDVNLDPTSDVEVVPAVPISAEIVDVMKSADATNCVLAPISDDEEVVKSSNDVRTAPTSDDKEVVKSSDDVKTAPTSDDEEVVKSSIDVKTAPTSDDKEVVKSSDDVKTAPTSDDEEVVKSSEDVKIAPTSDDGGVVKSSDHVKTAPTSDDDEVVKSSDDVKTVPISDDEEVENSITDSSDDDVVKMGPNKTFSAIGVRGFEDEVQKDQSSASLRSFDGWMGSMGRSNMTKWSNMEDLDGSDGRWVVGDSDTESIVQEVEVVQTTNSTPESIASSLPTIETDVTSKEDDVPVKVISDQNLTVEVETDWQYQLPSPPTAFRDSSPEVVENSTYESEKFKADSVVTSPELFEKLKLVKETQSEISEMPSSVNSEEEKPIFNKLSLENLEKRKSLVYNRELATSFKYNEEESLKSESISSKRSSVMSELEEVIQNTNKTIARPKTNDNFVQTDSSLPNFKITTYDMPKKKINIFEDDSVRSNAESATKPETGFSSMENVAYRRHSAEEGFKKQDFNKYRVKTMMKAAQEGGGVGRSESFSSNGWVPSNPVKRSKSQVAINQYKEDAVPKEEKSNLTRSSSLLDVSEPLQSLGVMRMIQTKLKTPTTSTDELDKVELRTKPVSKAEPEAVEEKPVQNHAQPQPPPKPYQYRGPPSINLGTWSDRPKSQILLKEDTDYKIAPPNVSIKVNGSEQITSQQSGNVIIKIGGGDFSSRFINHTTAVGYRKPLGNINKVEVKQRPHSMAFDSQFDISRVPIVRSMELKKPFKDMQLSTSITQICPDTEKDTQSLNYINNRPKSSIWVTNESKPVVRLNSFTRNAPVVKGFNEGSEKRTWNSHTLPSKPKTENFATNNNVPFSQVRLRRTDSTKTQAVNSTPSFGNVILRNTSFINSNRYSNEAAPPPPVMPKLKKTEPQPVNSSNSTDGRGELLSAIRSFGGKKGLKAVKV